MVASLAVPHSPSTELTPNRTFAIQRSAGAPGSLGSLASAAGPAGGSNLVAGFELSDSDDEPDDEPVFRGGVTMNMRDRNDQPIRSSGGKRGGMGQRGFSSKRPQLRVAQRPDSMSQRGSDEDEEMDERSDDESSDEGEQVSEVDEDRYVRRNEEDNEAELEAQVIQVIEVRDEEN
ncbi:hypothetical protein HDU93_005905 [Gonapodya sp. JEL0774]|nr:hypothetical protein HDU93_005905 [Gonapodya sp. JEL0774]